MLVSSTKSTICGFKVFMTSISFLLDGISFCSGESDAFEFRRGPSSEFFTS